MKMMKLWMLVVVATIASACSKQDDAGFEGAATKTVQFIATDAAGRTAFGDPTEGGDYPVLWQDGDQIKINANFAIADDEETKLMVLNNGTSPNITLIDGGTSATFSLNMGNYTADSYIFYAVCHKDAWVHSGGVSENTETGEKTKIRMEIPGTQTPVSRSCDPKAQVLFAKSAEVTDLSTPIDLHFKHVTAYGCMTLKHVPEAFTSVEISAEENLSYRCYYDTAADEVTFSSTDKKDATIKTNKSDRIILNTSSNEVWFAMIPTDLSGKEMTIKLTTANGDTYTKTITFANGDGNFQAGRIAKFAVNFADVAKDAEPFELYEVYKENGVAQGIVFWVSDNGQEAKIVSLDRSNPCQWANDISISMDCTSTDDGDSNTAKIGEGLQTNAGLISDPYTFCTQKGAGWYWPARFELREIAAAYHGVTSWANVTKGKTLSDLPEKERMAQIEFDKLLIQNGGVALNTLADGEAGGDASDDDLTANGCRYWSSTENSTSKAVQLCFGKVAENNSTKTGGTTGSTLIYTRAIKKVNR